MIHEWISRFRGTRNQSSSASSNKQGESDPILTHLLSSQPDELFVSGREEAVEKLQTLDVAAFWVQAVGDGTPMEVGHNDPSERTPHHGVWEAGFEDSLTHQEIVKITTQLAAHHIGLHAVPSEGSGSEREALNESLEPITRYANQLYDEHRNEELQYPRTQTRATSIEAAISVLDTDPLSYFWLQILGDSGEAKHVFVVGGDQDSPSSFADHPIEFVIGILQGTPPQLEINLTTESFAQHLFVGSQITDQSIDQFAEEVRQTALNLDYLYQMPGEI